MREITYAEAVKEALSEAMRENEDVFMLGEDIGIYGGAFGVTRGMVEEFGEERIRSTPISESAIAGAAVGSAMTGMRPIFEIQFSDFITIALDQIVNQAAKIRYMYGGKARIPLVMRTPGGSGTGAAAQHSQSLENWTAHIPGLKVIQPATAYDAKGLLHAAIEDDNPVMFYEHKLCYRTTSDVPAEKYTIPIGVADIKEVGTDITVVATGIMVHKAIEAAKILKEKKISIEVVDPRTLVPLDKKTITNSVMKTGRAVVVTESVKRSGFSAELASVIAESESFDFLDAPIVRLAGAEIPMPYHPELEKKAVPQVADIVEACEKLMAKK
ncbi:Acetoin dehydrogenase E1 component beta-subunit [Enterococcus mundtii 3F]|uniref:alpha-ketoacid dehydrogenase subunit beta n=1 Tax=Enterococcus mundtii TaxID=53346 RepID=UPI00230282EA|nr:alpha-ketoacid dehydrogenase subunit beta [Enterococcus mundtii]MDA9460259.1 Acetoin dehydrogenase E1 component beta-subunit [Enterococcus mundtii 3F]